MAFVGGIFAIYALLEHSNVFGSAETSNMILLVEDLINFDVFHIAIRLGSLLVYAGGITTALFMSKYHPSSQKFICLAVDCVAALILDLMPPDAHPVVALYPVAFAMSVQWCSFRGIASSPSATTFSTGNFRQLVTNIFLRLTEHDKSYSPIVAFYAYTMLSFHAGVAAAYILWHHMSRHSIWIVCFPLALAAIEQYALISQKKSPSGAISQSAGSDEV